MNNPVMISSPTGDRRAEVIGFASERGVKKPWAVVEYEDGRREWVHIDRMTAIAFGGNEPQIPRNSIEKGLMSNPA